MYLLTLEIENTQIYAFLNSPTITPAIELLCCRYNKRGYVTNTQLYSTV